LRGTAPSVTALQLDALGFNTSIMRKENIMAIDFRTVDIFFDPTSGREQNESGTVFFNSQVIRADVALKGFDIQYTDDDHNLFRQIINATITAVDGNGVTVNVTYLLRDSSGNIDDRFHGLVHALVIAEVQ